MFVESRREVGILIKSESKNNNRVLLFMKFLKNNN